MLQPSNTGAELADPELSAVYAESQNRKRKRHDSLVTLTALEMVFATRLDEHVHHTTDAAQSPLLRPLGSGSPLCLQRDMFTDA